MMAGLAPAPAPAELSRTGADLFSFRVFAAIPPGTLGDGYVRMAGLAEDDRR